LFQERWWWSVSRRCSESSAGGARHGYTSASVAAIGRNSSTKSGVVPATEMNTRRSARHQSAPVTWRTIRKTSADRTVATPKPYAAT
jgi:hypothetical protein